MPNDGDTVGPLLRNACLRLVGVSETPRLDVEILLAHVLNKPRSYLYGWPEQRLDQGRLERFAMLLARRVQGEPVAYLSGKREFWSLELKVTPAVLIPRPETEVLVEQALERIPPGCFLDIADLGTGSGAIALVIARERPRTRIIATDISTEALEVAAANACHHRIANVAFRQGDWCRALGSRRFHLIVANPPYIASHDSHLYRDGVCYEPRGALVAGSEGLEAISSIIAQAKHHLRPNGWLLLEHGYDQGERVVALLTSQGFQKIANYQDPAGIDRVVCGCYRD